MLGNIKLIELGGLGAVAAITVITAPLAIKSGIPPSQITGAGVAAASIAAVAIVVSKPKP